MAENLHEKKVRTKGGGKRSKDGEKTLDGRVENGAGSDGAQKSHGRGKVLQERLTLYYHKGVKSWGGKCGETMSTPPGRGESEGGGWVIFLG